jgi:hypothetical protein
LLSLFFGNRPWIWKFVTIVIPGFYKVSHLTQLNMGVRQKNVLVFERPVQHRNSVWNILCEWRIMDFEIEWNCDIMSYSRQSLYCINNSISLFMHLMVAETCNRQLHETYKYKMYKKNTGWEEKVIIK